MAHLDAPPSISQSDDEACLLLIAKDQAAASAPVEQAAVASTASNAVLDGGAAPAMRYLAAMARSLSHQSDEAAPPANALKTRGGRVVKRKRTYDSQAAEDSSHRATRVKARLAKEASEKARFYLPGDDTVVDINSITEEAEPPQSPFCPPAAAASAPLPPAAAAQHAAHDDDDDGSGPGGSGGETEDFWSADEANAVMGGVLRYVGWPPAAAASTLRLTPPPPPPGTVTAPSARGEPSRRTRTRACASQGGLPRRAGAGGRARGSASSAR